MLHRYLWGHNELLENETLPVLPQNFHQNLETGKWGKVENVPESLPRVYTAGEHLPGKESQAEWAQFLACSDRAVSTGASVPPQNLHLMVFVFVCWLVFEVIMEMQVGFRIASSQGYTPHWVGHTKLGALLPGRSWMSLLRAQEAAAKFGKRAVRGDQEFFLQFQF